MFKVLEKFFDHLEDNVRNHLSHYPIVYAFIAGVGIILMIGMFVSFFIGDSIIIAGIKREKKIAEKTETEIETEKEELDEVRGMVQEVEEKMEKIEETLDHNKKR